MNISDILFDNLNYLLGNHFTYYMHIDVVPGK